MSTKRRVVCDIETSGLDTAACSLWCVVCYDIDTDEVFTFSEGTLKDFQEFSKSVSLWIGHNILAFDAPVINRVCRAGITVDSILDTLIMGRLVDPMIQGGHGLEAWGKRLGFPKQDFNDWSKFTPAMLEYCINDVKLTVKLYHYLKERLVGFSNYSVELEHAVGHILNKQRKRGWYLDQKKVEEYLQILTTKRDDILNNMDTYFPPRLVPVASNFMPRRTKSGGFYAADMNKLAKYEKHDNGDGTYELFERQQFNMSSPKQIVERMNEAGWKPYIMTKGGAPSCCEENFATLPEGAAEGAKKLVDCKIYHNRITVLNHWKDNLNLETGRVHGTVIGTGTITHRMAHHSPQMANIPAIRRNADKTLVQNWATELRGCWTVSDPTRYCMVGTDIAGIQLCILAHYLENPTYINALATGVKEKGTDMHSINMMILREIAPHCTRDNAKTFIYALLLGAGGGKLGTILGISAKEGNAAKELLMKRIEGFDKVKRMCASAAKVGYMIGLDGRKIEVKSEHYALSSYLQGGEAVVMKQALVFTDERARHLDWGQLMVIHDEIQSQVLIPQADELGKLQVQAMVDAGAFFELLCPVTGEYRIGKNWSETH